MPLEHRIGFLGHAAAQEAGHHLAEEGDVVLGLMHPGRARDAQALEVGAQLGQRALMQEAGQVVGGEGQQLAAAQADEEVVILALKRLGLRQAGGGAECTSLNRWPSSA
jgi:hypothetical protein